jgi:hypothetical protein
MQGFCGGAITPTVWPVVYTKFHGQQLATVIAIISVILTIMNEHAGGSAGRAKCPRQRRSLFFNVARSRKRHFRSSTHW